MTGGVPPARQCDLPECGREAVDPGPGANACPEHHPDRGDDGGVSGADTPDRGAPADGGENRQEERDSPRPNPRGNADVSGSSIPDATAATDTADGWGGARFGAPEPAPLPEVLDEREQWMCRQESDKTPFAPWADRSAPVECNHADHDMPTTCEECEHDARWKWGDPTNYRDGETAAEWVRKDPRLAGRVFLQQDADPFAFVDGDDVRDPDTGEVHPAFVALLEHLGVTYADVSTSGAGVHAYYHAPDGLPVDGKGQATFPIDTEPWGANDDPPTVEIYANRHVCVTTADHVPATPVDVHTWDADALRAILEASGYGDRDTVDHDTDRDRPELDGYDPDATGADDTADDVRDVLAAVDDLRPRDLPLRTRQVGTDGTGWEQWDPSTYRQSSGGDSLHTPDRRKFHDHKKGESFGVLKLFALERGIISKPSDRLTGAEWWETVEAAREAGAPIPEYVGDADDEDDRAEADPRKLFDDPVVVEPRDAWRAAGAVRPGDLDPDEEGRELSLAVTDDGDAWATADDRRVHGVVRAVALEERLISDPDTDLETDIFDEAYRRARRHYGAPLPEYVDETTATNQKWVLYGALDQVDHYHLDGILSTVTDTGEGDVVAEINPSWEYSASGHRVLAFRSGWFYCREHDTALDPLRFVALEEGILDGCHDDLEGEAFLDAVDALRNRGAPVPRYDGEVIDHEAVLPDADDLLEEFTTDADRLHAARQDVEAVVEEAAADATQADLVTALPALGKTTSTVKNAATQPTLYAAPRKELQAEVVEKAKAYGVSTYILPVLAENHIRKDAKAEGAAAVREVGQDLLRRREELLKRIESEIHPDPDADDVAEDDEVDLDRRTCPTANGAHGEGWQVAVQVAAELGYHPEAMHNRSKALFGAEIPCTCDDEADCDEDDEAAECAYSQAWEHVADPDRPVDLLVGSRTHAYVRSARTWYGRDADDRVDVEPRAVAIDEFPDDAYGRLYGAEAPTIATWLATALREDLDDHRDVLEGDVWGAWVRDWIHGTESGDALAEFRQLDSRLEACRLLLDARDTLDSIPPADRPDAAEAFRAAVEEGVGRDVDTDDLYALTDAALASVRETDALAGPITGELGALLGDLRAALGELDGPIGEADLTVEGDRLGETLRDVVDTALEGALCAGEDHALEGARDVCRGGEAGTRALAVHADDPYAHPDAYLLLAGMVGEGEVVRTQQFRFDATRPHTHLTRTRLDGAAVLFDRDHDGAYVLDPPEFVDTAGRDCPVLGLDATGRETLWSLALGEDVERRDIHGTARERREVLRDVLNLQVVQTSPHVNSYSHVANKNFDGDVELVRTVAEEYGAGRLRANTLSSTTKPGVITTKKARGRVESRLEGDVAAVDHYGNVTGSNELADCNIGVVLGSRHFSDAPVEKWAALAGEEVARTGHGADLSYGSDVAEEYLAHMREDQTMQSILRFGRDEEGALVFAHTSALAEDLPVVGDGAVVSAHSSGGVEVRDAMLPYLERGRSFTVSDIVDDVGVGRRTVQRKLQEFAELGYLDREDAGVGRASTFAPDDDPGHGDVELPAIDGAVVGDHDSEGFKQYSTGIVAVRDADLTARGPPGGRRAQLPAPSTADTTVAGVDPPG